MNTKPISQAIYNRSQKKEKSQKALHRKREITRLCFVLESRFPVAIGTGKVLAREEGDRHSWAAHTSNSVIARALSRQEVSDGARQATASHTKARKSGRLLRE